MKLIDQEYAAVKGISGVVIVTNKLNMHDKGLMTGFCQDVVAFAAVLNLRLPKVEHSVTAMKLKIASMEL